MPDEQNLDEAIEHLLDLGLIQEVFIDGKSVGYCLTGDDQAVANAHKDAGRIN